MNRMMILVAVAAFALVAGACSIDVERNEDGSLELETVLTEDSLKNEISKGIDDPQVNYLTIDMKIGHALVAMERVRDSGIGVDEISFRVDLRVADGHLAADVTEAVWNEFPIPQDLVDIWNEELAAGLEKEGKKDPDSTLLSVELTENALTMQWHVETDQSKG
ncbi:MAG: hypothetical protein QNL12_16325 [Acidimicrobiia bacterium]|nr:hypothetical protein [Acidimicrobiia bacterium]MDX2468878.1 hypothetical protein [Acidimicrobiia bacterium]